MPGARSNPVNATSSNVRHLEKKLRAQQNRIDIKLAERGCWLQASGLVINESARLESLLRCQFPLRQVVLRRNSKGISHAIKERKHCDHVNSLRDLLFAPSSFAKFVNVFLRAFRGRMRDHFCVFKERAFRVREFGLIKLALGNRCDRFVRSSLDTQEVSVAVQSIRTTVEV